MFFFYLYVYVLIYFSNEAIDGMHTKSIGQFEFYVHKLKSARS